MCDKCKTPIYCYFLSRAERHIQEEGSPEKAAKRAVLEMTWKAKVHLLEEMPSLLYANLNFVILSGNCKTLAYALERTIEKFIVNRMIYNQREA